MARGGKRAGAGRPRGSRRQVTTSIGVEPALLAQIDAAAEADDVSRSAWIVRVVERALRRRRR